MHMQWLRTDYYYWCELSPASRNWFPNVSSLAIMKSTLRTTNDVEVCWMTANRSSLPNMHMKRDNNSNTNPIESAWGLVGGVASVDWNAQLKPSRSGTAVYTGSAARAPNKRKHRIENVASIERSSVVLATLAIVSNFIGTFSRIGDSLGNRRNARSSVTSLRCPSSWKCSPFVLTTSRRTVNSKWAFGNWVTIKAFHTFHILIRQVATKATYFDNYRHSVVTAIVNGFSFSQISNIK